MIRSYGLKKLPKDNRDFKLDRLGGIFDYPTLPKKSFRVSEPLIIKNQGSDDTCVSRSISSVLEDTEKMIMAEEWIFSQIKKKEGSITGYGADLRQAFKIPVKVGALSKEDCPFSFATQGRNFCANWSNYGRDLYAKAVPHKQKSFFSVHNRLWAKDHFDSIILTLYQNMQSKLSKSVGLGLEWHEEYNSSAGVIDRVAPSSGFGHAMKGFGYDYFPSMSTADTFYKEKEYLLIQNSGGVDFGDHGLFRLSREVANSGEEFGAFCFVDLDEAKLGEIKNPSLKNSIKWHLRKTIHSVI